MGWTPSASADAAPAGTSTRPGHRRASNFPAAENSASSAQDTLPAGSRLRGRREPLAAHVFPGPGRGWSPPEPENLRAAEPTPPPPSRLARGHAVDGGGAQAGESSVRDANSPPRGGGTGT